MKLVQLRMLACLITLVTAVMAPAARADDYECTGHCNFGPDAQFENLIVEEGATVALAGGRGADLTPAPGQRLRQTRMRAPSVQEG